MYGSRSPNKPWDALREPGSHMLAAIVTLPVDLWGNRVGNGPNGRCRSSGFWGRRDLHTPACIAKHVTHTARTAKDALVHVLSCAHRNSAGPQPLSTPDRLPLRRLLMNVGHVGSGISRAGRQGVRFDAPGLAPAR